MPLSYKQLGNTFIQGENISIYPSGNSYVISGNAPNTDSFGFAGIEISTFDIFDIVFLPIDAQQDLTGPDSTMIYKSFSAGTGIGIIDRNNTLIFTAATSTVNGLTSFTSAGTGQYLLLSTAITSNTLFYKSLTGASNLSIDDNGNGTLTFNKTTNGTIISGVNVGTNANSLSFFSGLTTTANANDTLAFRNISGGPNIFINTSVDNDGDILISRGPSTLVNQLSNIGGGARVLSAITTTNSASTRTLSGVSGLTSAIVNNSSVTGSTSAITASTLVLITPTNTTSSLLYISNATSQLGTSALFGADNTTGSLGIGGAASTTSRLPIAAGTGAISQLRLTPFSTPISSPTDGDIWYSTTGNTLKFRKDTKTTDFIFKDNNISLTGLSNQILLVDTAGTITPNYINSFGAFSSVSSLTLTNTTTETSIIAANLIGSKTLLASTNTTTPELLAGRKYRFNAKGTLVTSSLVNLTLRLKLGSTTIGLVNGYSLANPINGYFEIDFTFTIRSTGALGSVFGSGKILSNTALKASDTNSYPIGIYTNTTTIDTTSNQIFDCTTQFSSTGTVLTINESSLEFLT